MPLLVKFWHHCTGSLTKAMASLACSSLWPPGHSKFPYWIKENNIEVGKSGWMCLTLEAIQMQRPHIPPTPHSTGWLHWQRHPRLRFSTTPLLPAAQVFLFWSPCCTHSRRWGAKMDFPKGEGCGASSLLTGGANRVPGLLPTAGKTMVSDPAARMFGEQPATK